MKALLVIITESKLLARTLDRCLSITLGGKIETNYMTYDQSRLSKAMLTQTDLFILDLFGHDALGCRAEGIYVAEHFAKAGRKSLLISNQAMADMVNSNYYWDVASPDHLAVRVLRLLKKPPQPTVHDFAILRTLFGFYCRPVYARHGI